MGMARATSNSRLSVDDWIQAGFAILAEEGIKALKIERLCRDGKRALWAGIKTVKAGARLSDIGRAVQSFADRGGYTLIRNLASHGVGASLHEDPGEIPTWYEPRDTRRIANGLVFTIEPFLSLGASWAEEGNDGFGGCDADFAQKLGAEVSITGTVQKVSNLILNINLYARVVATREPLVAMSVDIRGNTDESWSRGLDYLVRTRFLPSDN